MRTSIAACCLGLAALFAALAPASAEKRVALVIGNAAYKHVPRLANPGNDASDMAAKLRELGFEVLDGVDLQKRDMEKRIRGFATLLAGADVGLFYYAGHGLQVDGKNFLAPTDAELKAESDLDFEAVDLDLVLKHMVRNAPISIVFLDACRDNPLATNLAKAGRSIDVGRGLAPVATPASMMIVYATEPGNVALDGSGRNSPFTAALLRHIGAEGASISDVMIDVRKDVLEATGGNQRPFESASLTGKFFFKPRVEPAAPSPSEEIAALKEEVARLQEHQGALLKSQQEQLERLQAKLAGETDKGATPPAPSPAKPAPAATATAKPEETKIAAAEPPPPQPATPSVSASPLPEPRGAEAVAKDLHEALKEIGCYAGAIDGTWDAGSQSAIERFNGVSKLDLPEDEPLEASLDTIKAWKGPDCPAVDAATPSKKSRPAASVTPKKQVAPTKKAAKPSAPKPRAEARPRPRPQGDSGGAATNELQRMFPEGAWAKPKR